MIVVSTCLLLMLYAFSRSNADNCTAIIQLPLENKTFNCESEIILLHNKSLLFTPYSGIIAEAMSKALTKIIEIYVSDVQIETLFLGNVTLDSLQTLRLPNNSLTNLYKSTFGLIPNLRLLDLSRNRLLYKDLEAFHNLPSLKVLNLSHNHIASIPSSGFATLSSLEVLDLSHNSIYGVSAGFFNDHQRLRTLYLQHNGLSAINLKIPTVIYIDASFNAIRNVNLPDLLQLNLENNQIRDQISFSDVEINISNNSVTSFKALSDQTRYVSARHNRIETVSDWFFHNSKGLEYLDLSHNAIAVVENQAMATLIRLKVLNLSHNKMADFKYRVLDGLDSLEILDISFNNFIYLYDIPFAGSFTFDNLGKLDKIILNNNQWSCNFLRQLSRTTFSVIGAHTTCKSDVNDFVIDFDKTVPIESDTPQSNRIDEDEVLKIVQKHLQSGAFNRTLFEFFKNLTGNAANSSENDATLDYQLAVKIADRYLQTDFVNTTFFQHVQNLSQSNNRAAYDELKVDQSGPNKTEGINSTDFIKTELFSYILLINTVTTALLLLVVIVALVVLCKRRKYKVEHFDDGY